MGGSLKLTSSLTQAFTPHLYIDFHLIYEKYPHLRVSPLPSPHEDGNVLTWVFLGQVDLDF